MQVKKATVVVLTNLLAPYRISVWSEMQESCQMTVMLTGGENPHEWEANSPVIDTCKWSIPTVIRTFLPKKYQNGRVLIVHPLMQFKYVFTAAYARITGWHVIFFYYSTTKSSRSLNKLQLIAKKIYFKVPNLVITVGPSSSENVRNLRVANSRIIEFFNAVDSRKVLRAKPKINNCVERLGHRFLFVGQLIARKNVENIILGFYRFRAQEDTLTIIGSGELQKDLETLTKTLNLSQHIVFKGKLSQEDTYPEYFVHDTLIMPSTEEVWGLVANEALTAGMHVVVTPECGVVDLIADFEGVHICSADADSIGQVMQECSMNWTSRVSSPQILKYDTTSLAVKFINLIQVINDKKFLNPNE